jgi:FlaA1/EpsC-like NDP-sugar epimerase
MSRTVMRTAQVAADVVVLALAYWLAFMARFDGELPLQMWKRLLFTWPYVVGCELAAMYLFSVPRFAWRYVGLREATRAAGALLVAAVALLIARVVAAAAQPVWGHAQYMLVPVGVIAGNFLLAVAGVLGVRVLRRLAGERDSAASLRPARENRVATLLIGAGRAGVLVAKEIEARPDLQIRAVGFLDDDSTKHHTIVHGVRVLGATGEIARFAARTGAKQALLTFDTGNGAAYRRVVRLCEEAGLKVKVIPGIFELLHGNVNLSRIRDVSIEDLLGRDPVALDTDRIGEFLRGKSVLVTGAGGSIGSELCRQVLRFGPSRLVLVEQAEFALFTIHQELLKVRDNVELVPRICDVSDRTRIERVFTEDQVEVVFHAAAHKHVPMMEWNPGEAIKNNVLGTRIVADAAGRHGCQAFVMISTDKAVNPTSIMGATKRVAEMYVQALSSKFRSTKYVAVRFGNVLGSAGSVIPVFKQQIAAGGPVTVTHPEMRRYFMTIPEASQLVMEAAAMGRGGEIFVLDMGEPVRIVELAEELIRLSGLEPGRDIEILFSGVRPGEKLFEELGFDTERMDRTTHPKIFVGRLTAQDHETVTRSIEFLAAHVDDTRTATVRRALGTVVPEMQDDATESARRGPDAAPAAPASQAVAEGMLALAR